MRQKYKLNKLPQITSGIVCVTVLAGLLLSCTTNHAFADSEVDEIVVAVPSSCTFEVGGGGTYNLELDNNDSEVVTANDITVSCNDVSGYAIYAIGFSGDSYYGTNTDLISATDTSYNIKTDGTGNYGSSWKMKLTAVSNATIEGNYSSTWQNIPSTYVKVASFNSNTTAGTITPSYQVNISATQIAGSYTGKVKYTLVHPNNAEAPLLCNPSGTTISTIKCMQDISSSNLSSILSSMTLEQQYQLSDSRDEKKYYVAKLQDGNIWMTQNLDLDIDSTNTYTPADTDIPANWTPRISTRATNDTTWPYDMSWPESYDPGDVCWDETLDLSGNYSGTLNTSTVSCTQNGNHYHLGNYYNFAAAVATNNSHMGASFEQSICPAGWMLPDLGHWEEEFVISQTSFQHLVDAYGYVNPHDSEYIYETLPEHLGQGYIPWEAPLYFTLGGSHMSPEDSAETSGIGAEGGFWTSKTPDDYANAFGLYIESDETITPTTYLELVVGRSVRCVVRR